MVKDNAKGYFLSSAANLDRFANREFRTLWNSSLVKDNEYNLPYPFGHRDETISSALGKNQRAGTLSKAGRCLAWILDKIEKNHCIISIDKTIVWEKTPKWAG